jgi:hypothetical protein
MATTLEGLERRLTALEQEVARLRQQVASPPSAETPGGRWAQLLREARMSQAAITAASAKAFQEMGITVEPVSHEKLREMMLASGIKPEDNIFSREIIAMREE